MLQIMICFVVCSRGIYYHHSQRILGMVKDTKFGKVHRAETCTLWALTQMLNLFQAKYCRPL